MLEITEQNAAEILHARGWFTNSERPRVRELSGGVSNAVFSIEQGSARFIVKQARGKLRVQADWQCSIERIWREVEVLAAISELLKSANFTLARVPQILWTDPELYAYAMTSAGVNCETWKEQLLTNRAGQEEAITVGLLLGTIHAKSWHNAEMASKFQDRTYFAQLRVEPYYLAAAQAYPPLSKHLRDLVDQTWQEQHALVHGDFSPKNFLESAGGLMLIDFEVGHYGDPAFDLGFCLTHLILKAIHFPERARTLLDMANSIWTYHFVVVRRAMTLPEWMALHQRGIQHLAGCLVARVHGKSPVEYLTTTEQLRAVRLAEQLFALGPAASWEQAYQLLQQEI